MVTDPDDGGTADLFGGSAGKANRLLKAGIAIQYQEPSREDRAFMAKQLVQCTLPHRNPGNVPVWSRANGNLSLVLQPYYDRKSQQFIYPYGSVPRLLLFWMTTEAKEKGRRLELGNSLSAFMRDIGLNPDNGGTGAKRSDARRLKDQMNRLFRARISFEYESGTVDRAGMGWLDMDVAPAGELWWDHRQPEQDDLFKSWIELGETFYAALIASTVPVDRRALRALKRSPLELDLYAWATYRTFTATQKGENVFISWAGLAKQLGSEYGELRDFKKAAIAAFKKIQTVYPDLSLRDAPNGFLINPSKTSVLPR